MYNTTDLLRTIDSVAGALIAASDQLNALDAAVGDGDLGVSIAAGCSAVRQALQTPQGPQDAGTILRTCGVAFQRAAPSTMGTLLATALLAAAREVRDKQTLDASDASAMLVVAEAAVRRRGKAVVGDKTMLDALVPATAALSAGLQDGRSLREAAGYMTDAAQAGMANTTALAARIGRARWLGERSCGHQDGGATVIVLILEGVYASCDTACSR